MSSLAELMSLKGRVALITGGAGHIGQICCETLAEQGANVVPLDICASACHQMAESVRSKYNVQTLPLVVDVSSEAELRRVPDMITSRFGRLDILVNCAALVGTSELKGWSTVFSEQSSTTWRLALETNLTAVFVLVQQCADALAISGHGSILNFSSIYGVVGPDPAIYEDTNLGNPAAYAASKGALVQLTRWLATMLAPRVRVNSLSPGGLVREQALTFQERYAERTPLRRMGTEQDLKGAVAYLASDLSSYVTGHNLVVDGGWTAW